MPRYVDLDKLPQIGLWRDPEDHGAVQGARKQYRHTAVDICADAAGGAVRRKPDDSKFIRRNRRVPADLGADLRRGNVPVGVRD